MGVLVGWICGILKLISILLQINSSIEPIFRGGFNIHSPTNLQAIGNTDFDKKWAYLDCLTYFLVPYYLSWDVLDLEEQVVEIVSVPECRSLGRHSQRVQSTLSHSIFLRQQPGC